MNIISITGRATKDAVLGQTANGTAVAKFTLASEKTRRKKHQGDPESNFIPVELYGKKAESLGEYLKKGKAFAVAGCIQTDSYKGSDGKTKYAWKVVGDYKVEFLPDGAMSGMNSVTLVGRLASDAQTSFTKDGMCILNFTVASDKYSKDKNKSADFIPVTLYGKLGESLGRYLVKGKSVSVTGKLDTDSYKNSEGTTVYTWKVIADEVRLNGDGGRDRRAPEEEAAQQEQQQAQTAVAEPSSEPENDFEEAGFVELPPEFDEEYFDEPF